MTPFAELDLVARTEQLEAAVREIRKIGDAGERTEQRVSRSSAIMSQGFARLARMAAAVAAPLLTGALFSSSINEARTFETTMLRVQAVIDATGGAAGRSADQLREQARQLALGTLESTEGVLRAQQTLLTFRNVQGDVFDRAIVAAADMASALGGDLNSATMQLARALENPTEGISALTRSGTVFTQSQKDIVAAMVEAGDMAGAQGFILAELEAQYGGTARAASQGFAGAQDTAAQRTQELKLALAEQLGLLALATSATNAYADGVLYVTEALPSIIDGLQVLGVVVVALASTQIPALVAALAAKTAGMTAASIAAGVLTGSLRVLGVAVAFAGGPLGLLLGIAGGAAAAMLLLRDNTATAAPIMDEAKDAIDRINSVLATSSESALPAAARATLNLTNENIRLAQSAYAAAEAQLALARSALIDADLQVGVESMFSGTGDPITTQAMTERAAAMTRLRQAGAVLQAAQQGLTSRINEGQLALSSASDAVAEHAARTIELRVTTDDLAAGFGNMAASGGAARGAIQGVSRAAEQLQGELSAGIDAVTGLFSAITGGEGGVRQALGRILRQMAEVQFRNALIQSVAGGSGGGLLSGIGRLLTPMSLPSFDGGGQTGGGARSGGMDGRGGFLAMLHPNETVIDHTKPGGSGAPQVTMQFNIDARGAVDGVAQQINDALVAFLPQATKTAVAAIRVQTARGR